MKKTLAITWNIYIWYWPVQINGNKFATDQILKKQVEVVKGRILVGWAQKSPELWQALAKIGLKIKPPLISDGYQKYAFVDSLTL